MADVARTVARIFAIPSTLTAMAALLCLLAPAEVVRGIVFDNLPQRGRSSVVAPYQVTAGTAHGEIRIDVSRAFGEAVDPGDSLLIQRSPYFGTVRSVRALREGRVVGSSALASSFYAWLIPALLLLVAGALFAPEVPPGFGFAATVGMLMFNVGGAVWGVVVAFKALSPPPAV